MTICSKTAFQNIADHTRSACGSCRVPHGCCHASICEQTIEHALEIHGVVLERTDHPKLPLMGPTGCVAAPTFAPCAPCMCVKTTSWKTPHGHRPIGPCARSPKKLLNKT